MPILERIVRNISSFPLRSYNIVSTLHLKLNTLILLEDFIKLGAKGVYIFLRETETELDYLSTFASMYNERVYTYPMEDLKMRLEEICKEETLVCDEGGECFKHVMKYDIPAKLITLHTTRAKLIVKKYKATPPCPVYLLHTSIIKRKLDTFYGCGISSLSYWIRFTGLSPLGRKLLVIGAGDAGKGIARAWQQQGGIVYISDYDPRKLFEAVVELSGVQVTTIKEGLKIADIIITATGCNPETTGRYVLGDEYWKHLDTEEKEVWVGSMGSGDELGIRPLFHRSRRVYELCTHRQVNLNDLLNGKINCPVVFELGRSKVYLVSHLPYNLFPGDGHPNDIMDASLSLHLLIILYYLANKDKITPGIYEVPDEIDCELSSLWLEERLKVNSNDEDPLISQLYGIPKRWSGWRK
jgi:adenosylhomocysteinase